MALVTLLRIDNLYLDAEAPGGRPCVLTSAAAAAPDPRWIAHDRFAIRLRWLQRSSTVGAAPDVATLPANSVVVLAMKTAPGGTLLASASDWTETTTESDCYYSATVSLHTSAVTTWMAGATSAKAVTVDVEVQDSGNTERLTWQFTALLVPQVYAGESSPDPEAPEYPAPGAIVTRVCGSAVLTPGERSVTVGGVGAAAVPSFVLAIVRKPAGGDQLFAAVVADSVDADGFTADLSAAVPADGEYYLDYLYV